MKNGDTDSKSSNINVTKRDDITKKSGLLAMQSFSVCASSRVEHKHIADLSLAYLNPNIRSKRGKRMALNDARIYWECLMSDEDLAELDKLGVVCIWAQ
jgi:hypothetical protein